jgi:hypothetical protein
MALITEVDKIPSFTEKKTSINITDDNLTEIIYNLSLESSVQIMALERYEVIKPDEILEHINKLCGMYQFSGTKKLYDLLAKICTDSILSNMLKIECAYSLLSYEKMLIGEEETDNITIDENKAIKKNAYNVLNNVCKNLKNIPTPCKINVICELMKSVEHIHQSLKYFKDIISDVKIECDYRYKTVLLLENKNIITPEFFIRESFLHFLYNDSNYTMYRILSAQYLLQKCELKDTNNVEQQVMSFAQDNELDYNLRADAADTLLRLGNKTNQNKSREIIMILGRIDGGVRTMFENAQNVHTEKIEQSVIEIIEKLCEIPLLKIKGKTIGFNYVNTQINEMLKNQIETINKEECKHCKGNDIDDFCSMECKDQYEIHDRIKIALNRINLDSTLYSKYNITLSGILLRIWTFLSNHENEEEMKERLIEELEEMSGTCSTGFASRLINVVSGFSDYNIRISWEDQIIGNLSGRLNALARSITDKNSVYYNNNDVIEFWLKSHKDILGEITKNITGLDLINHKSTNICLQNKRCEYCTTKIPSMITIINKFLEEDKECKITTCVQDFAENVINEMTIDTSKFDIRNNFLYFFRTSMPNIREEMYDEFNNHINDTDFELYFRKAIMTYEGDV